MFLLLLNLFSFFLFDNSEFSSIFGKENILKSFKLSIKIKIKILLLLLLIIIIIIIRKNNLN